MTGTAETVYAAVNGAHVLFMSSNSESVMNFDKEHAKCIVHCIPNNFGIVDSAWAGIVLRQCRLSLK
jgi:hypothetical protein